jgi:hypothetical protein
MFFLFFNLVIFHKAWERPIRTINLRMLYGGFRRLVEFVRALFGRRSRLPWDWLRTTLGMLRHLFGSCLPLVRYANERWPNISRSAPEREPKLYQPCPDSVSKRSRVVCGFERT